MRHTPVSHHLHSIVHRLAVCVVVALASAAWGGSVKQHVSSRTGSTGEPITLSLIFENVQTHEPPVMPQVPGLQITSAGPPSVTRARTNINGHVTEQSTLTYRFLISAETPGAWALPAIDLHADDSVWQTEPMHVSFTSSEDPEHVRTQLVGVPKSAWLGDILPITLRILIKPYRDAQLPEGVLSATDMWGLIRLDDSTWGPFRDQIAVLARDRRLPPLSVVQVPGPDGPERWYAYDITVHVPLVKAGPLDLSSVRVAMDYPLHLGRGRGSLFEPFPQLRVTDRRLVTSTPPRPDLVIQTPPEEGRPPTWAGAVGRFHFDVAASHTDAEVGEPITLTMTLSDVGPHPADLDLLQAPRLDADKALVEHFRVPADRPGGIVSGRSKTFTQTVRPTKAGVDRIPPIPFTYFDPSTERYETAFSRPIDIRVRSATQMDASDLGQLAAGPNSSIGVTSVQRGLLANYTDPDVLLQTRRPAGAAMAATILVTPPFAFLVIALARWRRGLDLRDPSRVRRRKALHRLDASLAAAGTEPDAVAAAIRTFVADRSGMPERGLTSQEAADIVRGAGGPALADDLSGMLTDLEARSYTGDGGAVDASGHEGARLLCKRLLEVLP